jgi:hypothetical protein
MHRDSTNIAGTAQKSSGIRIGWGCSNSCRGKSAQQSAPGNPRGGLFNHVLSACPVARLVSLQSDLFAIISPDAWLIWHILIRSPRTDCLLLLNNRKIGENLRTVVAVMFVSQG